MWRKFHQLKKVKAKACFYMCFYLKKCLIKCNKFNFPEWSIAVLRTDFGNT